MHTVSDLALDHPSMSIPAPVSTLMGPTFGTFSESRTHVEFTDHGGPPMMEDVPPMMKNYPPPA